MRNLYPDIRPYRTLTLDVDQGHTLYVEESGNPDGLPVLFVHGGPGSGVSERDRRFFNPEKYRIVLFDQRGSGKSTPHASLQHNTTPLLLQDIEKIRETLAINSWMLFGGSWGATLSLLYAQAYPKRVLGLVLRGVFLARKQDIDWFFQRGASRIFPDHWREFVEFIPEQQRNDLVSAYYNRLTGDNELERMSAAKHWSTWEARCATLNPNTDLLHSVVNPHRALSLASIEAHYVINHCFIQENQIIDNIAALKGIPATIVHGRYDMVCPLEQAYLLHQAWPDSQLEIIRDAGHSSADSGIIDALVKATDNFANELSDAS